MTTDWTAISGKPYDWTKTLSPERPYIHDYTKTFTMKMFLAEPDPTHTRSLVHITFEEALELIRDLDRMTLGVPKIIYLVGWQYYGHDSKYPSWGEVNEALKRPCDNTALESMLWLMEEGYKYNTTVSVHINMYDAYDNSPDFEAYVRHELIAREADGSLKKGGIWNNRQAYIISYAREWESGFAKERIDRLCRLLPLVRAGTVHIDAFHGASDPGHGLTLEDNQAARLKIYRYWRSLGIDVTSEFLFYETPDWLPRQEQLLGIQPLAYHFSQTAAEYIRRPASLMCGCYASYRMKEGDSGELGTLFGEQATPEPIWLRNKENWKALVFTEFCEKNLPFLYLNTLERDYVVLTKDDTEAHYLGGVTASQRDRRITKNGTLMRLGYDALLPTDWFEPGSAVIYSRYGGTLTFDLSTLLGYPADGDVRLRAYSPDGIGATAAGTLTGGKLTLSLEKNSAVIISLM